MAWSAQARQASALARANRSVVGRKVSNGFRKITASASSTGRSVVITKWGSLSGKHNAGIFDRSRSVLKRAGSSGISYKRSRRR